MSGAEKLSWSRRAMQAFCRHAFYVEDIRRQSPEEVTAPCCKCGRTLRAPFGLALSGEMRRKPKEDTK